MALLDAQRRLRLVARRASKGWVPASRLSDQTWRRGAHEKNAAAHTQDPWQGTWAHGYVDMQAGHTQGGSSSNGASRTGAISDISILLAGTVGAANSVVNPNEGNKERWVHWAVQDRIGLSKIRCIIADLNRQDLP